MGRCAVFAAGEMSREDLLCEKYDFVIAADAGYLHVKKLGMKCDLAIGDFDSCGGVPENVQVMRLPCEKDDTDTLAAVKKAAELGFFETDIYGALGGRPDHSFANIQTLVYLAGLGVKGRISGNGYVITAIKDGEISFPAGKRGTVSVFCAGDEAEDVDIKGLKYTLSGAKLRGDTPIGVSNEFIGKESFVRVKKGTLIVMWQRS